MKQKLFIALTLVSLLFTACSALGNPTETAPEIIPTVIADNTIIAEGRLEPIQYGEIAFTAGGVVSEVLVKEGQTVKKGDTLIRLGDESDTNYAAAQLELVTAQQALNDLVNSSDENFAQVVIDLKQANEDYADADQYLRYLENSKKVPVTETFVYYIKTRKGYEYRIRTEFSKGPAPKVWITEAENDLALKKAKMEEAQRAYDRVNDNGVDSDQLALLEARVNAAKANVATFFVLAPFDGVVAHLAAKAGSSINPGQVAVTVADFSDWLVKTTDLTEIDVVELSEGQPVTVTLDAIPGVELNGEILSIGQTYAENQGDVVYDVNILLTDTHPAMRWGMTASVLFESQE
jgi:multidrug resistance efflux pump